MEIKHYTMVQYQSLILKKNRMNSEIVFSGTLMVVFLYSAIFVKNNYFFKSLVCLGISIGFGLNCVHLDGIYLIINILLALSWALSFIFCATISDLVKKIEFLERIKKNETNSNRQP